MTMDRKSTGEHNEHASAGSNKALLRAIAAGYALQHLFDSIDGLQQARDKNDVRTEQDMRASAVAAQHMIEWFREKGVTFDDDLRPIAPAMPLDLPRLKSLHGEAMHLAFRAIVSAGRVTGDLWSDRDWFFTWFLREMELEAFKAGAPNRLWKIDPYTDEPIEMRREVCARLASTGQLVDLEGFPATPFPRSPFPGIEGPSSKP